MNSIIKDLTKSAAQREALAQMYSAKVEKYQQEAKEMRKLAEEIKSSVSLPQADGRDADDEDIG